MKNIFSTILLVILMTSSILAAPLKNVPCTITQPNGEVIHCFVSGDEYFNYYHDADGYTIIINPETRYYTYAVKQGDEIVPSEFIVGQTNPRTKAALTPGFLGNANKIMARRLANERRIRENAPAPTRTMNHGRMNNLVVFISFADDTNFIDNFTTVENMFNDTTSENSSSMKNYFQHASYNQFTIQSHFYPAPNGDIILSYHDIHPKGYYRTIQHDPIWGYADEWERHQREADLVDSAVRFMQFMVPQGLDLDYNNDGCVDNMVFVINSDVEGWSELLWPHRTSLWDRTIYIRGKRVYDYNFQLARNSYYFSTSTLCHEMFHSLSAPDLYGYEIGGNDHTFVGSWDLMEQNSTPPQNMGAYMKYRYGHWIDEIPSADTNGLYTIYPVATSKNSAYKIPLNDPFRPNEYLILEYRNTNYFFDSQVYGTGAVIYRINDEWEGNAGVDFEEIFPEVYAFRKNGQPSTENPYEPTYGVMQQSVFGGYGMNEFSKYSNPFPFFTNGDYVNNVRISNITNMGDSLQFQVVRGLTTIDTFPWRESFESQYIPLYCYNEFVNNTFVWKTAHGNNSGSIPTAHSGEKNASYYYVTNGTTKLVMPNFDFTFLTNPTLSFWYAQQGSANYTLKVYYRTSPTTDWTLLETYNTPSNEWAQKTISLPNPTANYQIAFEASGSNGSGLLIDDIEVAGQMVSDFQIVASAGEHGQITPEGNVVVPLHGTQTFTLTPETGYTVDVLTVDGVAQQRRLEYTFEDVVSDHTINATFKIANPSLSATPSSLVFYVEAGDTSQPKEVYVNATDLVSDIDVSVAGDFLVSVDQENYAHTATMPYNGGWLYVVCAPAMAGIDQQELHISNVETSLSTTVILKMTATGIEDVQNAEMQMYPNPAYNELNLIFNGNVLPERIEIVDICGRTVLSQSVVDAKNVMNVSKLEAGVYFVKADNLVKKFIKK